MAKRTENTLVSKEQCPRCAEQGKDNHQDNLGVYSDGHIYCFSCGYYRAGTLRLEYMTKKEKVKQKETIYLPSDITTTIPYKAKEWLFQYELNELDIKRNVLQWSPSFERLIFPIFVEGELIAYQGRYIKTEPNSLERNKWFSKGDIHDIIYPINVNSRSAVLVEDIVSAIKVGHITGAIPLFGSNLNITMMHRLKYLVDKLVIWLDPDKRTESIKFARALHTLGVDCQVVLSEKDPKEHTYEEIIEILIDKNVAF